ncbi:diguanylate cyclase domain-containing protein [Caminibacter sp.]
MTIENFIDDVKSFELEEIKDWRLEKLIKYIKDNRIERLYIKKNGYPYYVIDSKIIIDILFNNLLLLKIEKYFKERNVTVFNADMHIIETYNFMRKQRIEYAPVVKDNVLIGEINFNTLSLKISYIAIKDPLTNAYNEKYFNVLVEEYNEIATEVGIIMIKILNLAIYEGLYGVDFVNIILKQISNTLKCSIRNVDFLFRNDDVFKILTFNDAEITMKIKHRIESKLENLEIDSIPINCKIVATHVPEIDNNIIWAVEELERKLIKRD